MSFIGNGGEMVTVSNIQLPYSGPGVYKDGVKIDISAYPTMGSGYNFNGWSIISGNCTIASPNLATTSVILNGGPATIGAKFSNP
jgi:hypothetical protein